MFKKCLIMPRKHMFLLGYRKSHILWFLDGYRLAYIKCLQTFLFQNMLYIFVSVLTIIMFICYVLFHIVCIHTFTSIQHYERSSEITKSYQSRKFCFIPQSTQFSLQYFRIMTSLIGSWCQSAWNIIAKGMRG